MRWWLATFALSASVVACYPGKCNGGIGRPAPFASQQGEPVVELGREGARLITVSLHCSTGLKNGSDILEKSSLDPTSVVLQGANGPVPIKLEAFSNPSAHSCAGACGLNVSPEAPLEPGDYVFVILLDQAKWPAVDDDAVSRWQGHPALIQRYHVK